MEELINIGATLAGLGVILLGLNDDIAKKKSQLLFVLSSNAILIFMNYFGGSKQNLIASIIIIFLFGGLGFMGQEGMNLEKELDIFRLLFYSSIVLFFLTYQIFSWLYVILLYLIELYPNSNFLVSKFGFHDREIELLLGIILMSCQYIFVVKDFFAIRFFSETIKLEWRPNIDTREEGTSINLNYNEDMGEYIEKLSFVVFTEDKTFFERKTSSLTFFVFFKKILSEIRKGVKFTLGHSLKVIKELYQILRSNLWSRRKSNYRIKKNSAFNLMSRKIRSYFRGYSTLEQQFIRQYAMGEYSYRYKFRRKILVEWIYTPFLLLSIRRRKSRTISSSYKRRKITDELILPLKLSILESYFKNVLGSPNSMCSLKNKLVRQSSLTKEDIDYKYGEFSKSQKKSEISSAIKSAMMSKYRF